MRYIISFSLDDYKWLWRAWTGGMILSHLLVLSIVVFIVLIRAYQAGELSPYWPGVPLLVAIACTLILTAAEYE